MPIKFNPFNDFLAEYEPEIDFQQLGINNLFIYTAKYIQVENNKIVFLNRKKRILGVINFKNEEKAVNFFNFLTFLIEFKIIFKDKFAIKKN